MKKTRASVRSIARSIGTRVPASSKNRRCGGYATAITASNIGELEERGSQGRFRPVEAAHRSSRDGQAGHRGDRRTALDDRRGWSSRTTRTTSSTRWRGRKTPSIDLREFFGGDCLADDLVARLPEYKEWRRQQPDGRAAKRRNDRQYEKAPRIGCSVATLNRELAALRHAFVLAARTRPRWSRPCRISSCRRSGTGASVFLNGTSSLPCASICPTIESR